MDDLVCNYACEPEREAALRGLAERLGIPMSNVAFYDQALTHASSVAESTGTGGGDYESLEFLGDAVLGLAVAHHLFTHVPGRTPGEYSRMRAGMVNRHSVARVAHELGIEPLILLGRGEEACGGRRRASLAADCMEALIAAVYLDCGWVAAREFVARVFEGEFLQSGASNRVWDYKSRLQNLCQAGHVGLPRFEVIRSEGPDHLKEFEVEVYVRGAAAGRGRGRSKKEAEQNAAREALEREGVVLR